MKTINQFGLVFLTFILVPFILFADQELGRIARYEGVVFMSCKTCVKKTKLTAENRTLYSEDIILTMENSQAFIEMNGGSRIIVKANSQLSINDSASYQSMGGRIFFNIKKLRKRLRKFLRVKVPTALIGVKGTQFAISINEQSTQVFLKSGRVWIEPQFAQFIKRLKDKESQYERDVAKREQAYKEFQERKKKAYYEVISVYEMNPGDSISITSLKDAKIEGDQKTKGNILLEDIAFTEEVRSQFDLFKKW